MTDPLNNGNVGDCSHRPVGDTLGPVRGGKAAIPVWVFDVDGTLANNDHRAHHLAKQPKDWDSFFDACHLDPPHEHIVNLARALLRTGVVLFLTGRREQDRKKTSRWLHQQGLWRSHKPSYIYMRPDGDHRPDHVVKLELLAKLRADGYEPIMIFEDRTSVVAAWRAAGVPCAQVAEGNF